ncbi:MAG: hypothetical protein Q9161_007795 [Pseudevernia consocians]
MENFHNKKPLLLSFRSSKAFIVFVVSYAIFVDQFVYAVIVPVMPFSLHQHGGVSDDHIQYWVSVLLSVYGIASFVVSPFWGWYTDRSSSRRIPFLLSLLLTAGSTIMIWRSSSIALQVAGRVLQGSAAAFIWITGLAMIADTVGQKDVGQSLAYMSMAMMIGTLVAPLLGGVVFARVGYDAVFEMTLGLIGLDILFRFVMIERKAAKDGRQEDILETSSHLERAEIVEKAVIEPEKTIREHDVEYAEAERNHRLGSTAQEAGKIPAPLKPRGRVRLPAILILLSSRRLISALWGTLIQGTLFSGLETVLPLQTQAVFGWNSEGGGLIFLPLTLTAFSGPAIGWFCDRHGPRWPAFVGFLLLCPFLTLLRLVIDDTLNQKVLLCVLLTLAGFCFTMTLDPLMAEIAYVVEQKAKDDPETYGSAEKVYAQAFALFSMAWSLGNTVGPLFAGLIRDAAGWGTMSWALGLIGGVTAVPIGLWCGGWIFKQDTRPGE